MATLTYSYADSTAVLGPLSSVAEPHAYDLCAHHTQRLTVPRGWEVVKLPLREHDLNRQDDLLDIADALRAAAPSPAPQPSASPRNTRRPATAREDAAVQPRIRHLRSVNDTEY